MIDLSKINHIYLYPVLTDMRLGIYGLRLKIIAMENKIDQESLYIFCGKNKNQIKIIETTKTSIWLYQNKLFKGKFIWPDLSEKKSLSKKELDYLINGISVIRSLENRESSSSLF